MKKTVVILCFVSFLISCVPTTNNTKSVHDSELYKGLVASRITLPNGWSLTPVGHSIDLDDLPLNLVVSPSKKWIAVTNNGQSTQTVTLIDVASEKIIDNVEIKKSWVGLAFSFDEQFLYVSGGNDNLVAIYKIVNGKLVVNGEIVLGQPYPKDKISPGGLCVDSKANRLYVVAKDSRSLFICDTKERKVIKEEKLESEPYTCALSPSTNKLFISLWGASKVIEYDPETERFTHEIATNSHPNDLVFTKNGKRLFVPNGNDNTVSVIETSTYNLIEHISASLYPESPIGTTPNGVALSEDEQTLFVANADNNCVSVFDISVKGQSRSKGFIPTGWYPTSVKVIGNKIFVTNGKGFTSKPNPKGPNPMMVKKPQEKGANPQANKDVVEYIGGLFKGTLSIIDIPTSQTLATYSHIVFLNTPYSKKKEILAEGEVGNPIPRKVGENSPIKYVFYVIKENRTYDQVLGDVKKGNGDSTLCIFPKFLTPNQHKLVNEFVLLDNFYVDAEVSADGHNWSTAAYANDYVEKNWVTSYGGRGGTYDYEGSRKIAHPKNGFIWDFCKRANVSFRTYGEFVWDGIPSYAGTENNYCKLFHSYDLGFKDVDRELQWEHDFDSLLAINKVPQFNSIRLGNDHTSGSRVGAFSVKAAIADNDLAVGKLVEHLSKSGIWEQSAVFILEDDAQNGSDHVDAHRSTAYVAGGFVKRQFVDHTMYSTSAMLRTIELILGIPPMSQYDASATPLYRCFAKKSDLKPFQSVSANVDLDTKNVVSINAKNALFDLANVDAVPDLDFNEDIWISMRGKSTPIPIPKRSAFVMVSVKKESEDD
jgi:YVTN family beta-propeller protein